MVRISLPRRGKLSWDGGRRIKRNGVISLMIGAEAQFFFKFKFLFVYMLFLV